MLSGRYLQLESGIVSSFAASGSTTIKDPDLKLLVLKPRTGTDGQRLKESSSRIASAVLLMEVSRQVFGTWPERHV
jgi:hypothetical protein